MHAEERVDDTVVMMGEMPVGQTRWCMSILPTPAPHFRRRLMLAALRFRPCVRTATVICAVVSPMVTASFGGWRSRAVSF